jgi:hypothetical protein
MNREDFTENSIEQVLFDFWDNTIDEEEVRLCLSNNYTNQEDLIDFILMLHGKGKLQGICYP